MNISETNRHAIAIAEACCRAIGLAKIYDTYAGGGSIAFNVTPLTEILDGRETIASDYPILYRAIGVVISVHGEIRAILRVTLMRPREGRWQSAMIEHYAVGWVAGSYQYWARYLDNVWQVRELDRFAQAPSCGHFEFDYDWCEVRAIRAEKAAQTPS